VVLGLGWYYILYGTDVKSFVVFRDTFVSVVGCTAENTENRH